MVEYYYYIDNLKLNNLNKPKIVEFGTNCNNNKVLVAQTKVSENFQWYREGVALLGETSSQINLSGNGYAGGRYTVTFIDFTGKCNSNDFYFDDTYELNADFSITTGKCSNEYTLFNDLSFKS